MGDDARRVGDGGGNFVFKNGGVDRGAHAGGAARGKATGHIVEPGDEVGADQHAVARLDLGGDADAGAHFGIADDDGDGAGDARRARGARAGDGDDDGLVARRSGDDHVAARLHGLGDQFSVLADEGEDLVFKDIDVDGRADRRSAGAAGRGREDDDLLDLAIGVDGHAAGGRAQERAIAHLGAGLGLGDKHADGAGHGRRGAGRAGERGQHIEQALFADGLDQDVGGVDARRSADAGEGVVPGDDHRHRAAHRRAAAGTGQRGGDEREIGDVGGVHLEQAVGGDVGILPYRRLHVAAGDDDVDAAADGRAAGAGSARRHRDGQLIALGAGKHADVARAGEDSAVADARVDAVLIVHRGDVDARAHLAGGRADGAADHARVGLGRSGDAGVAAAQGDVRAIFDGGLRDAVGKEHSHGAGHGGGGVFARGDGAGDGLRVVVDAGEVVEGVDDLEKVVRADGDVDAGDAVLALIELEVDEALVGVLFDVHGKERIPAEGEGVVVCVHGELLGLDRKRIRRHGRALADAGREFIFCVDEREGRADARRSARGGEAAGSDGQLGLVLRRDGDVAAAHRGVFGDLRKTPGVADEDGDRAGEADLAAGAADAARERLRAEQAAILAIHVLGDGGGNAHVAVVLRGGRVARGGDFAIHGGVGLIAVDAHRHAHGDVVGVPGGDGHGGAGAQRAVVGAVLGVHVHRLRGEAAANLRRGDVFGDGRARGGGDVDLLALLGALVERLAGRAAGILRNRAHGVGGGAGGGRVARQHDVELLHQHGEQRHAGNGVRARLHGGAGEAIDLVHDGDVQHGRRFAEAEGAEHVADAAQIAVEIRADHGGEAGGFIFIGSDGLDLGLAGDRAVAAEGGAHVGVREVHAHRRANGGLVPHREAGGRAVRLAALEGAQVEADVLKILSVRLRGDEITAREIELRAGTDDGMHHIVDHRERHGGVDGDVLGGGVVLLQGHLTQSGHFLRDLVAAGDGIAAGDGNGVKVVAQFGDDAQRGGVERALLAQQRLGGRLNVGDGRGSADADGLALRVAGAVLVLVRHAVLVGGGSGGGVDLLRALRVDGDHAGGVDPAVQVGDRGFGVRLKKGDGGSAGHADVGSARAGDSRGGNEVAHAIQLAGVAELDVHGRDHHIADALDGHLGGEAVLFKEFVHLALRAAEEQAEQELGIGEHIGEGADHGIGKRAENRLGGIDRLAAELRSQQFDDQRLERGGVIAVKGFKGFLELGVVCKHVFEACVAARLHEGVDEHVHALGVGEVGHEVGENGLDALFVLRFEDVRAHGQGVRAHAGRTEISHVADAHVVDGHAHAHAGGGVGGAGVGGDDGVRIHQRGDGDIAIRAYRGRVANAGGGIVFEDVERQRGGDLNAALLRLGAGTVLRQGGNGAAVDVVGADAAGQSAGDLRVQIGDAVRLALGVEGADVRAARAALVLKRIVELAFGVAGSLALLLLLLFEFFERLRAGGAGGGRRALGAGDDLLVKAADGLRVHKHACRVGRALQIRRGGIVEDADAERAADAYARAHGRGVHLHGTLDLTCGSDGKVAGEAQGLIRGAAEVCLRIDAAHAQRQHRHHRGAARRAGRGFDVFRAMIGGVDKRRGHRQALEAHAVLDARGDIHAHEAHGDARADAGGVGRDDVRRLKGDDHAADRDAAAGALAGGVAHGEVVAGAGGLDRDAAAFDGVIAILAHRGFVDRRGEVYGDGAAEAEVGRRGDVARLDGDAGAGEAHVRVHAQIFRGDDAAHDLGGVVVVKIGDADGRTDGLLRRGFDRRARDRVERRRAVERGVGAQLGIGLAAGKHHEVALRVQRAGGVDARGVVVIYIGKGERARELLDLLFRLIDDLHGLIEEAVQPVGAGDEAAQSAGDVRLDAEQFFHHADDLLGGDLALGILVGGDVDRHSAGAHAGGGVHPQIARQRQKAGLIQHFDGDIVLDEGAGNVHTRDGLDGQRLGPLAHRGRAGGDGAVGDEVYVALRFDLRVALDRHMGVEDADHQREGELGLAADGVRGDAGVGIGVQLRARAGADDGVAADRDRGLARRHANGDGNDDAGKAVGGVDKYIQFAAQAHGAAGDDLAKHVHGGVAHLQHERLQLQPFRDAAGQFGNGQIALAEGKAGQHVHRLAGFDAGVRADGDAAVALGLVKANFEAHVVFLGKVVVDDGKRAFDDDIVRANRLQEDVPADNLTFDVDALAADKHVHALGDDAIDGDFVVACVVDDVGEQQTRVGNG